MSDKNEKKLKNFIIGLLIIDAVLIIIALFFTNFFADGLSGIISKIFNPRDVVQFSPPFRN